MMRCGHLTKTYNFRLEGRFYLSFLKLLPFDVPEEGVMFDSLLSSVILKKIESGKT